VEGYDAATYGDRFADVYDDWYAAPEETERAVECIARLAEQGGSGPVLELGVGTGRLALPLAARGIAVTGLDSSASMLERLAAKPGGDRVRTIESDMAGPLPDGPWSVVVVARNTLFNLTTEHAQRECLREIARVLAPSGTLVVEAFVPDGSRQRSSVEAREVGLDRVVLFVDRHDPDTQQVWSSFVELTPEGNRFRPCHLRYATPAQLDELAVASGLVLVERWSGWTGKPFDDESPTQVSLYRRAPMAGR